LFIDNNKSGRFGKNQIYISLNDGNKVKEYWSKKGEQHRKAMRGIAWDIYGAAFK
jgi:hypothetical protein